MIRLPPAAKAVDQSAAAIPTFGLLTMTMEELSVLV
jgi:hypothetical protein